MSLPLELSISIDLPSRNLKKSITLHNGLTVILGPNGSGKTQLLRGIKNALNPHLSGRHVCFISAGRIGTIEQYRSDYDGYRHRNGLQYDELSFGSRETQNRRDEIETLNGTFQTLAARPDILLKVRERMRKLFKREIAIQWDSGNLKVYFSSADGTRYSSGREASGLLHLVGLLAALYDDQIGALLLDEPEVSLHPQLQAFLLQELLQVSGWPSEGSPKKLVLLCTHSTEFVVLNDSTDLLNLVFTSQLTEDPIQIRSDAGELNNKKISSLIGRMGQEHKLALFASSPLLVEGPSDVIVAASLSRRLGLHLEAGGSQLLPVIGKGQFPVVAKLFRMMGKQPVILADADAVTDDLALAHSVLNSENANLAASNHAAESANDLVTKVHGRFSRLVEQDWGSVSDLASAHRYWINRDENHDPGFQRAKRRSAFSTLFTLDDQEIVSLENGRDWLSIKNQLGVLLALLESEGCFVLRKGTIEDYFVFAKQAMHSTKPEGAALEAAAICDANLSELEEVYSDVIRCLSYASFAEKIDESEVLQKVILGVCAPAQLSLREGQSIENIRAMVSSMLPELSPMFAFDLKEGKLEISLNSKILDVSGFPLLISPEDNIVTRVSEALKLRKAEVHQKEND